MARKAGEPELVKIKNTYHVRWRDELAQRTRTQSLETSEIAEAARNLADWCEQTQNGDHLNGLPLEEGWDKINAIAEESQEITVTVVDVVNYYIKKKLIPQQSPSLPNAQKVLLWMSRHFGDLPVKSLKGRHIDDYVEKRLDGDFNITRKPPTPGSVRSDLIFFNAAMNFARRQRMIKHDDVFIATLPPAHAPRDKWLTIEQTKLLLEKSLEVFDRSSGAVGEHFWRPLERNEPIPRVGLFAHLAYYTAGRKNAIETLTWGQVDFEADGRRGIIHLNPEGRAQTKKRRASVPINSELLPLLARARDQAFYRGLRRDVFERKTVIGGQGSIRTAWQTLVTRIGLGWATPHVMRHSHATHLSHEGVPIQHIADVLGNTASTTDRSYRKSSPSAIRSKVNIRLYGQETTAD